jgi:hypothetical protein
MAVNNMDSSPRINNSRNQSTTKLLPQERVAVATDV